MRTQKKSGQEVVQDEHLKKMRSPIYRKRMKRMIQDLRTYNNIVRQGKASSKDLRDAADFFMDDLAVVNFRTSSDKKKDDNVLKGAGRL